MPRQKPPLSTRSRPARTRAARLTPDTRRTQLLACAVGVFAERGIHAARHAEIATVAGVSVSAVFFYFPTRQALVDAVLADVEGFYRELVRQALASDATAPGALLALATAFADSVDAHPDRARVWLDWSTAFGDPTWRRYRGFQDRVVHDIAVTIEAGQRDGSVARDVDAPSAALLVMGAAYIVVQMKITRRPRAEVERFLRVLVRSTIGRIP